MVLVLLLDVATNGAALRRAHRKSPITFLPCKVTHPNLVVHPAGSNRFEFAEHISQAVRCAKANQQMHMIGDAADAFGNSVRCADDST